MKRYLINLLAPSNSNTKYKIWVALSLMIQVVCALVPPMILRSGNYLHDVFLYGTVGIAIASLLIIRTQWQKWIAYGLALYGLTMVFVLVAFNLTNTGILIYLLAWSMSVSLGYGRELFNLKWFFGFMSVVLVFFACVLLFAHETNFTALERAITVLSGTSIIAVNIYLWSLEARMSTNHYSERRQKYEDIASLSEKMKAILSTKKNPEQAFYTMAKESEPSLHLDYCMIYLLTENGLESVDGNEKLTEDGNSVVCASFRKKNIQINTDTSLSNFNRLITFPHAKSEIAAPIFNDGKIAGVIYGASLQKDVLRDRHSEALSVIASFCGLKLTQQDAEESIREAERTKAEVDQYKELDDLKNRFIANISHDLKTPLSLIKAPAKQIMQLTNDEKIKSLSNYVINNADHLLRVVHQLLQLNRIEKGINELYFQQVDVLNLFKKINGQYEERAYSTNIELQIESEQIMMTTDAFRLEQIIHNLLSNALRYTPSGGKIKVIAALKGARVECVVSDTGAGIPRELQEKVFDRFYKIDENNQEGTGIGLSLVQEYVQLLEGTVKLTSEKDKGTTFTLNFPLFHSASDENQEERRDTNQDLRDDSDGKPHMLIVEDHADLNQFVSSYFENTFVTHSAFDGEEGLEKMNVILPDIIITDLMMPKKDGNSFVKEVRQNDEWAHIPIIVLSAKSQAHSKIELYESGVDNFLAKPFDIEELEAVVNATLKQRKTMRDSFREKFIETPIIINTAIPVENDAIEDDASTSVTSSKLLDDLKQYVLDHLDEGELSTIEIAKMLGVGRNRFQKEIKDLSGVTPVEFIRSLRLNEAKNLLKDRSKNISEVAYAVGFSNLSYFTRSFKQEFGKLPSEIQN